MTEQRSPYRTSDDVTYPTVQIAASDSSGAALPHDIAVRTKDGHALEVDHPGHSAACRWTCATCGDAVLSYRGNIYGGATERTCAESRAFWGRWA